MIREALKMIKLFDVKWDAKTAGPSPCNNERTELFLLGCKKAKSGNPCPGCFNSPTWDDSIAEKSYDPVEMAEHINAHSPNKYITIGGGEPTDQIDDLIILCKELKKHGFHIMVYTWRSLKNVFNKDTVGTEEDVEFGIKMLELLKNIDMIVDGQYIASERLYQEDAEDGAYNSIGSGNQIVWDLKHWRDSKDIVIQGQSMKNIIALAINQNTMDLKFLLKDKYETNMLSYEYS
jgi:organic radical activating enzyme